METITLKELSAYLPFRLKAQDSQTKEVRLVTLHHFTYDLETVGHNHLLYNGTLHKPHKPILYPLSWLTKPITHNVETFVPIERLICLYSFEVCDKYGIRMYIDAGWTIKITELPFDLVQQLLEWRFDVFNLIERNLAVPVTNDFNPYK